MTVSPLKVNVAFPALEIGPNRYHETLDSFSPRFGLPSSLNAFGVDTWR